MRISALLLAAAIPLCSAQPGLVVRPWTDQYPDEAAAATKTCGARNFSDCRQHLLRLHELLDGRGDIVYRLAKVEANLGHRTAALEWLTVFSKMGLTFADPASELGSLKDNTQFQAALSRLALARKPVTRSRLFATLPENDLVAEDIAFDSVTDRFYISSVRHRKILSMSRQGKTAVFTTQEDPTVWAILALGVDAKRSYLWASTASMPECLGCNSAQEGRSALLRYSLDSGTLLKRYDLPRDSKHALGDMTVSAAGDVFVSDGYGAVYWVDHARDSLELLIGNGTFRSPQTPALSPDSRSLFVPDYSRGISIVDVETQKTKLLKHPNTLSLGGIDGLYLAGRTMLAVQNGTAPPRIIQMRLDSSLTRILEWKTIEANWEGLGAPTHGVIVGKQFYFIANSGWDQLNDDGKTKEGAAFTAPTVRVLSL